MRQPNIESNYVQYHYHSTIQQHAVHNEWEEVVVKPPESEQPPQYHYGGISYGCSSTSHHRSYNMNSNDCHRMSYFLRNLRSDSSYDIKVQARNIHGWNRMSAVFHFSTQSDDGKNIFFSSFFFSVRVPTSIIRR